MNLAVALFSGVLATSAPDATVQSSGQGPVLLAQVEPSPLEDMEDTRSIIRGVVAEVLKSDKVIRLNLGAKSPRQRFAAVIYPEQFSLFPNVEQLEGKTVQIRGPVSEFGGRPQILLKSANQLAFLTTAPAPKTTTSELKTTGEEKVIRGLVAEVLKSVSVIRINLGAKFPDRRATALIYPEHFAEFPQVDALVGKAVEITGAGVDLPDCPHVLLLAQKQIAFIQPPAPAIRDVPEGHITTGQQGTIRGMVAEVIKSARVIRINLGDKAPHHRASAVIYYNKFALFPDVDQLVGKTVEMVGDIAEYGGKSQVLLEATNQVAFLTTGKKRGS